MDSVQKSADNILDSLAEAVYVVDQNFRITHFNEVAESITGFKEEDVLGKPCRSVFRSDVCSTLCPIAASLHKNKSIFDVESQILNADNIGIPIRLNAAILKNKTGEPTGAVVSFRDMSAYKEIKKFLSPQTHYWGIIGKSKSMRDIFDLITEISDTDATVLICGETGTGKERIADAIHQTSKRKDQKFVKVNCAVLPPHLLASELFGHARGAFTDAVRDRIGRFEYADKGTIFLDEIAEIPVQTQLQLLRIIQEGTFERVGESTTRKADVRIIAATNANLNDTIKNGTFREDLYYRLNVIPIEVPPLRKRREDIIHLAGYFIKKYSMLYNKEINDFDSKSLEIFYNYNWPGNVRELENTIEYAVIRSNSGYEVCACNLPANLKINLNCPKTESSDSLHTHSEILRLLELHHWNRSKVAKILGIDRSTLWRRLKSMGLSE